MADFLKEFEDQQTKSLKGRQKTFDRQVKTIEKSALGAAKTEENKTTIKDVISQITSAMNVGSKPKREDFIDAAKELSDIQSALSGVGVSDSLSFDSELLKKLQEAVQVGLDFIAEQKPSLKGAAVKGIANKMKETSTGFVKGMAMETVSGIPFGAAVVDWMGAKMSGFGESLTQGKKLTETELGIGRAFSSETAETTEDIVEDVTKETAKSNGGASTTLRRRSGDLANIPAVGDVAKSAGEEEGGIVSEKNLEETNDILRDILEAVTPDREALEEAKRRKEMLRQEQKGGKVKFGDKGWMKAMMSGVMAGAMVVGAIAAAVGALVMMVFDGITGYFKAEEWGVSKTSAVIGAVIGGTGHGFTGAMWGAAKGGAAGFAIGLGMGGPLGALIGGLVGVTLGAIAGWFGGKRIAKLIEELTIWFERKWKALKVGLMMETYSDEEIKDIVEREGGFGGPSGSAAKSTIIGRNVKSGVSSVFGETVGGATGEMARGITWQLDEAARIISALDPTGSNFLGTGLGLANLTDLIPKEGIFGAPLLELFSASKSNLYGGGTPSRPQARGGIVTKPLYLPSSGIVVGEHPTYSGKGAYAGGLTRGIPDRQNNTGMEAIIPLDQRGIDVMRKATGADLNDAAMVAALRGGPTGMGSAPIIIDNTTNNNVKNENIAFRSPSPRGQLMHREKEDFVHKIA